MERLLDRFVGNISPAALLASSFFWSWFDVVPFGAAIFQGLGGSVELAPMTLPLAVSVVALGTLTASGRMRDLAVRTRSFALLSLLCGTGGAALLFSGIAAGSPVALVAAGVLVGLYEAEGIAVSGSIITCQGTTNALIHIALALPLNLVPILLVAFLEPVAALVLASLLPLLSALCFAVYRVRAMNQRALGTVLVPARRTARPKPSPAALLGVNGNFLAMVLVATIAFGVVNVCDMTSAGQSPFDEYTGLLIRAAVSAVVLFGYLRYSWRPQAVFNLATVSMAVSLIAAAVIEGPIPTWAFFAGYICFDLLIWALIIALGYQSGKGLLQTLCLVQAVDQLGIFLGTVFAATDGTAAELKIAFAALGVAIMLLVMGLLVRHRSVIDGLAVDFEGAVTAAAGLGSAPVSPGSGGEVTSPAPGSGASEGEPVGDAGAVAALELSAGEVAGRYFLSSREVDILSLLVSGRSGPYIAEHLCISGNTVKTHIRHIYTKLDVHDRQELLDLVRASQP